MHPAPRSLAALALVLLLAALPASADEAPLSAQDIVDRALDTQSLGFRSGEVDMTLIVQDRGGDIRERRLTVRGRSDDDAFRALVRVTAPAEVAGQSYLFRENPGGSDDVFVYLPALDESPRRIAGAQRNASFMGTHLTYADLQSRDLRDATYERHDDERIGRHDVYVIDARPAASTESEYARVRIWIRHGDFIPLRVRFFDARDRERRTMFTEDLGRHNDRLYVRRLTLRPAEGGATTMVIDRVDLDVDVPASEFTPQSLLQ
ncbi:MAG: outer membrane lipoprotein-sorting protein [Deltaproteobacteria bacterium]|nr:MAG: outer membrane lipoprotein-sorting protein [Deltaproteobacteria bacterium]